MAYDLYAQGLRYTPRPLTFACVPSKDSDIERFEMSENNRPDQLKVYNNLKGHYRCLLKCPTGWGKTVVLLFLLIDFLEKHPGYRVIIIVPQRIIGSNFTKERILITGGKEINWKPIASNRL